MRSAGPRGYWQAEKRGRGVGVTEPELRLQLSRVQTGRC